MAKATKRTGQADQATGNNSKSAPEAEKKRRTAKSSNPEKAEAPVAVRNEVAQKSSSKPVNRAASAKGAEAAGQSRKTKSAKEDGRATGKGGKTTSARARKADAAKPPRLASEPAADAKAASPSAPSKSKSAASVARASKAGPVENKRNGTTAKASTASASKPGKAQPKSTEKAEAGGDGRSKPRATSERAPAARRTRAPARPWLASYPKVVPAEIGTLPAESIGELMVNSCRRYAGRQAFTCLGRSMTFAELERRSTEFAAFLQGRGLQKGARVAIMMPNVLQYPVALMAVLRAGYTVVNVNPLYTPRELEHQLRDAGCEAIVILENFAATLEKVVAKTAVRHVVVASMGDMLGTVKGSVVNFVVRRVKKLVPAWTLPGHVPFPTALREGAGRSFEPVHVSADDIAFLQYTGGTTGVSKGAMLLHRNVLANVTQNALWMETAFVKREKPNKLVFVCALPLYHIYALTVNALMGIQQGGLNVLIPNPRDIPAFVKELRKHPFNVFPGLNTLFNALLNNEDFHKLDFSHLLLTFGGGMAVQQAVAERWQKLTGCIISEGYGLSETSPVATANRFDADQFSGTIGLPIPSTDVAVRDENGRDMPLGEVGEICIKGPQVMAGYWNRPDETERAMTEDGYFRSGDMGFMTDQGYIKIVDRKKDMILVSGFNVYPNEIEELVARHPGVLEVAAVGVPDERSGEVPKLFVVKKDASLTEEDLLAYCRENLTGYKRPRQIEFRTELPKSNVGKILRRELRG